MNKTKLKIIAGLLLVFLLGAFSGALGTGIFIKHHIQRFTHRTPGKHKSFFVERLSRRLELSDAQQRQADQIFSRTEDEIRTLLEDSRQQFDTLMSQGREELREILDPDQQEKLDAFFERIKKRWPGGPPAANPPTP